MKFILATKKYMTQVFDESGQVIAGTVVSAGPVVVTQIKEVGKDGYVAVQIGYGDKKAKHTTKAMQGHAKPALKEASEAKAGFKYLKEFKVSPELMAGLKVGDAIDLSTFATGDKITVSGISKGKGFQGVVKRHGFHGGPRTHGQKHSEREPGSIGAGGVQRVFKGKRMAGRMGSDRITVKDLKVAQVDTANGELFIAGSVPGRPGTLLEIWAK